MYAEALQGLTCPTHPFEQLQLEQVVRQAEDGELLSARMHCRSCRASYPISNGVLDLLGPLRLPDSITQLTNYLPLTAWGYERFWRPQALTVLSSEQLGYERELPLIVGLTAPDEGGLIIDVACANGLYARALERGRKGAPGHVIGLDHALPMLQQARHYALAEGLRISFVRASAQRLPFAPGMVRAVTMGGSLNEIGDAEQALRELQRVLVSGGRCMLMHLVEAETTAGQNLQKLIGIGGVSFPSLSQVNLSMAGANFRLRAQWRYGVVVFSLLTAGR